MVKRVLLCGLVILGLSLAGARADLEVNLRVDKVLLTDGSEIDCIVLMVTAKAVLIVESDPADPTKTRQRVIPANTVAKIIRGETVGEMTGFQTDKELVQESHPGLRLPQGRGPRGQGCQGQASGSAGAQGQ